MMAGLDEEALVVVRRIWWRWRRRDCRRWFSCQSWTSSSMRSLGGCIWNKFHRQGYETCQTIRLRTLCSNSEAPRKARPCNNSFDKKRPKLTKKNSSNAKRCSSLHSFFHGKADREKGSNYVSEKWIWDPGSVSHSAVKVWRTHGCSLLCDRPDVECKSRSWYIENQFIIETFATQENTEYHHELILLSSRWNLCIESIKHRLSYFITHKLINLTFCKCRFG